MIKGRTSGGSGTGGGMYVAAPKFVRVKKRAMVAEKACGKEGENAKVGDKRVTVAFVRKSTAVLLEEAGGSQDKDFSLISSSKTDTCTTPGGKRHLPASQQGQGGALEGKVAKRMKLEEDMAVRNSRKGRRKRRKCGQVVAAPAKKDHLEEALSYLKAWHNQKETWSFKKKMQVCLLEHMYDSSKVTHTHKSLLSRHAHACTRTHIHLYVHLNCAVFVQVSKLFFATLLKYLEGLQGKGRAAEVQRAKQIVEGYDCKHRVGLQRKESGEVEDRNGETPMQCALLHSKHLLYPSHNRVHQKAVQESSGGPQSTGVAARRQWCCCMVDVLRAPNRLLGD